jgi:hypothetical protein
MLMQKSKRNVKTNELQKPEAMANSPLPLSLARECAHKMGELEKLWERKHDK